jgi:HlyD family secretion protein
LQDAATGRRFYVAEVELVPAAEARGIVAQLTAGMPVEAVARTDARSPMSFLLKPVMDYWVHAMREE